MLRWPIIFTKSIYTVYLVQRGWGAWSKRIKVWDTFITSTLKFIGIITSMRIVQVLNSEVLTHVLMLLLLAISAEVNMIQKTYR